MMLINSLHAMKMAGNRRKKVSPESSMPSIANEAPQSDVRKTLRWEHHEQSELSSFVPRGELPPGCSLP
jgi:hypothetical protein